MKPTTKERMGVVERKAKTGAFSAAVLVAGLALGAGCVKDVPVQRPMPEKKVCKAGPEMSTWKKIGETYRVPYKTSQQILRQGEYFSIPGDNAVYRVVKVGDKSVDIKIGDMPTSYLIGREKSIGEFALVFTMRFDKCPDGKVLLTATYPDLAAVRKQKNE